MSVMQTDDEVLEGLSSDLAMKTLPRLGTLYSALGGAVLTALIVVLTPAQGIAGTLVIWYLMYMAVQTTPVLELRRLQEDHRRWQAAGLPGCQRQPELHRQG